MWPDAVAGDKAYSTIDIRNWLTCHEITAVIPYKDNEAGSKEYDRAAYRERPIIERTINRGTLWVQALPAHRDPL